MEHLDETLLVLTGTGLLVPMHQYRIERAAHRFWMRVNKSGRCWVWTGVKIPKGYGSFYIGQQHIYAHRFSYELHYGAIPNGLHVCHHCDNPPCVRPDHLFLGTNIDNVRDRVRKDRSRKERKQS